MRLLVYEDSVYFRDLDGDVYTDRAFLFFASGLHSRVDSLTMMGRLSPSPHPSEYRLPRDVRFVALPYYSSAAGWRILVTVVRSVRTAWRAVGKADVAWLMGPHPVALMLAGLAVLRRRRVVLGVRQDLPSYARHRHPDRRWTHLAAHVLEAVWRTLGRRCAVVAVGPHLAGVYSASRSVLELTISLVPAAEVGAPAGLDYDGPLQVLSVGRLDAEKNPLLLADILSELCTDDPRWHLVICGDGALRQALADRLRDLGVDSHATIRGYVPVDDGLPGIYRSSHALLHVSWTEGVPQVLLEAWGFGTPIVATAVGGVADFAQDAALLIPAGDGRAAVAALRRVAEDADLRERLVAAGGLRIADRTMEVTLDRLASFLATTSRVARFRTH
jgi:glycosyltransferase involved in cell wall biosynthesis